MCNHGHPCPQGKQDEAKDPGYRRKKQFAPAHYLDCLFRGISTCSECVGEFVPNWPPLAPAVFGTNFRNINSVDIPFCAVHCGTRLVMLRLCP